MTMRRRQRALLIAGSLMLAGVAQAGPDHHDGDTKQQRKEEDHEVARRAMLRHEVLPLPRVLALAAKYQPGDVIEIEFKSKAGILLYEVEMLTPSGEVRELKIDARTGKRISNQPKGK
jgi:uncharacterized membrane protein YkoI